MIEECPMCGCWSGPFHGEAAVIVRVWCDECRQAEEQSLNGPIGCDCEECRYWEKERNLGAYAFKR